MAAKRKPRPKRRMPSDRKLRAWIFDRMCNSELEAKVLVANMEACLQWIKHGTPAGLKLVASRAADIPASKPQ